MSCSNPQLMLKCDFSKMNPVKFFDLSFHYKKHGFQVDQKNQFLYRLVARSSRDLPLEKILEEYELHDCFAELLEIPCGHCIECRLAYSKEWATRVSLEAKKYQYNYFITLTYDPEFAPSGEIGNDNLSKSDFDNFIKDLRNYFYKKYHHSGIKYFGCGEYGDRTWRPHYHLIVFNCPIKDLVYSFPGSSDGCFVKKVDSMGVPMKFSETIHKIWNKGIITIQEANWNTGAYVSKYVLKKQTGDSAVLYDKLGVIPPFLRMSKGIGKEYLLNNKETLLNNPCIVVGRNHKDPLVVGLPRFYKKVLKNEFPEQYQKIINFSRDHAKNQRSLIKDKQSISVYRSRREQRILANSNLSRNLKEKA